MSDHQATAATDCVRAAEMSTRSGRAATRPTGVLVFAAIMPILAGCAIHPLPDDVTRETTHSIVQKIRCEAQRAVLDHGRRFGDETTLAYDFTFNIRENNNAQGGFTLTDPFKNGTFTLTASTGVNRTRDANRSFRIVDLIGELRRTDCRPEILEKNWLYPIAGDIGMYETVATFAKLPDLGKDPLTGEIFSFADTLVFTTTLTGNAGAKLSLASVTKRLRLTDAHADLNNSRTDFHKVILTLKAGPSVPGRFAARGRFGLRSGPPAGFIASSGLLSNTFAQQAADQSGDLRSAALYELDRQHLLELQRRGLLVPAP